MSRWIDNSKANPFPDQWEKYVQATDGLDESEITNPDTLIEFARLKKALSYTESMVKLVDPELNSINALNNPNNQLTASFNSRSNAFTVRDRRICWNTLTLFSSGRGRAPKYLSTHNKKRFKRHDTLQSNPVPCHQARVISPYESWMPGLRGYRRVFFPH